MRKNKRILYCLKAISQTLPTLPSTESVIQTFSSWYQKLLALLDQLQYKPQVLSDVEDKEGRITSKYSQNITPSLELPRTPKKVFAKKVDCDINAENITLYKYFYGRPRKYLPKIPVYENDVPVIDAMTKLHDVAKERQAKNKLANVDDINLQKTELVAEQIIEHSQRRADLFFYLLVAIYKKNVTLNKNDTEKQHGIGSPTNLGTNGCHCSLFPNAKLDPIPPRFIPPIIADFFKSPSPTLDGTHFGEVLNMTEELPRLVNEFDCHLEGKVHNPSNPVRRLTNITNRVAIGWWTPKQGMDEFYRNMDLFFTDFDTKNYKKIGKKNPQAMKKIAEYQKEGTFRGATKDHQAMSDDYFHLLMRMRPEHLLKLSWLPELGQYYYLESFYSQMQAKEIFMAKPTPTLKVEEKTKQEHQNTGAKKAGKKKPVDDEEEFQPGFAPGRCVL